MKRWALLASALALAVAATAYGASSGTTPPNTGKVGASSSSAAT